jgi:hypothetical protein
MKSKLLLLLMFVLSLLVTGNTFADGGRHGHGNGNFGVGVGVGLLLNPYWGPWSYPPSYYYPPYARPIIIERPVEQVYIQQAPSPASVAAVAAAPTENYWHYCAESKGYYPYVKECPGGWLKVSPQPPTQP